MKKIKNLFICPKFDPISDGLGHHTTLFMSQLAKSPDFENCHIITSSHSQIIGKHKGNDKVHAIIDDWNFVNLCKIIPLIMRLKPENIFVQYEPFMYQQRGGINFGIPFFLLYISLFKAQKVHTYFHELYHPFNGTFKTLIMFICHHLMFIITMLASSKIYCSTKNNFKRILFFRFQNSGNLHLLHVGANIKKYSFKNHSFLKEKLGILPNELVLGLFGTFHTSKNTKEILESLISVKRPIKILYIGASQSDVLQLVSQDKQEELSKILVSTGFASDQDCSEYFQILDSLICFFIDGLSTRRGSAIMALSHGVPIISSTTYKTEEIFKNKNFIKLFETNHFENRLVTTLNNFDLNQRGQHGDEIIQFHETYFSWASIVRKYIESFEHTH